jgi:hypothetical protein
MYNAPSVSYPVGRFAFVGVCLGGVTVLALVLQTGFALGWWQRGAWVPWRWMLAGAVWAVTLTAAWWHWWRSPVGWLIWEPAMAESPPLDVTGAQGWWWGDQAVPEGAPVLRVQPQVLSSTWALLHLTVGEPARSRRLWVWAVESRAPDRWLALRRALKRHAH